ncbi:Hypothetical protein PHPALM_3230 [Phytophthora palmivora]|uniref:Uncharacterized protein n=1 Tax=Phytophthora palmivora TaxID=4796 RepID=A0A2P4YMW1_9STRA|nr:Hypothetical protein PHPALM_3230 [Phytophthora palmivora]
MNPSQAFNDDFPRLIGAENFDVWKTRVCAAFNGKHLLGYVKKADYDGQRERRRQEAKIKAFLMKTMDNTHVRLVKNVNTSYETFTLICKKYEGAFFLKLVNAMKAAFETTESVMTEGQKSFYLVHSMPKAWKDNLRIWKGRRKYIPYENLEKSIDG